LAALKAETGATKDETRSKSGAVGSRTAASSASASSTSLDTRQKKLDEIQSENARLRAREAETDSTMRSLSEALAKENARLRAREAATATTMRSLSEALAKEKKTAKKTEQRRKEISQLKRHLKKASVVDICFLVDCTGSMSAYIAEVKSKIQWLVDEISQRHQDIQALHLAFVGYRDLCDGDRNYSILDFTQSVDEFRDFVGAISASGGCSHTADVAGGLYQVTKLTWLAPTTRILIHVCDVSGHGTRFHIRTGLSDPYPAGDPRGPEFLPETLLPKLMRDTGVSCYTFMRLTEYTDKMIEEFKKIATDGGRGANYGINGEWLSQMPLGNVQDLMATAMTSISATISFTTLHAGRLPIA